MYAEFPYANFNLHMKLNLIVIYGVGAGTVLSVSKLHSEYISNVILYAEILLIFHGSPPLPPSPHPSPHPPLTPLC